MTQVAIYPQERGAGVVSREMTAFVLTYHAIEEGPAPLCVSPSVFRDHLETLASAGVRVVAAGELARLVRVGLPADPVVALTFDDGFASFARTAAPLLLERGLTATVFCVAGRLGRKSDWATARSNGFVGELARSDELVEVARAGLEIGSHGFEHSPLSIVSDGALEREVVQSRRFLEQVSGASVVTFALPYGAEPGTAARDLLERSYDAVFTTRAAHVARNTDVYAIPRIDAHYVRRPDLISRAISGELHSYLRARRLAGRIRRTFAKDYVVSDGGEDMRC